VRRHGDFPVDDHSEDRSRDLAALAEVGEDRLQVLHEAPLK
jgi:hypothetical protein